MNYFKVILIILISVFLPPQVQAVDFLSCNDCHEAHLHGDMTRVYLHPPFEELQCGKCHVVKASASMSEKTQTQDNSTGQIEQKKTNRLAESLIPSTNHAFLLPGVEVLDTLVVDLHDSEGKFSRHEIGVPSLADVDELADSGNPPVISEIQVLKVHRGVLLTATIGWQTDTITKAQVRYGINDLSQRSKIGKRLGRQHQVLVYNLLPDRTYQFTAVSSDLFGRRGVSAPFTFTTTKTFTAPQSAYQSNLLAKNTKAGLASSFQRFGTDYLLELVLNQPALVLISSTGKSPQQKEILDNPDSVEGESVPEDTGLSSNEITTGTGGGDDERHRGLSSIAVISTTACQNCHQKWCRHPVNVSPPEGMTISPVYPTFPDGRIGCISCHEPHGSIHEFLTRKYYKKDLCVGCHTSKILQ